MIKYTLQLFAVFLLTIFISGTFGCGKEWLSPSPVVDSTIVAGSDSAGLVNGIGTAARFNHPFCIKVDASGNVYIADQGNSLIRKMDPTTLENTFAGILHVTGPVNGAETVASLK